MEPDGRKASDRQSGPTRSKQTGVYISVHYERYNRGGTLSHYKIQTSQAYGLLLMRILLT